MSTLKPIAHSLRDAERHLRVQLMLHRSFDRALGDAAHLLEYATFDIVQAAERDALRVRLYIRPPGVAAMRPLTIAELTLLPIEFEIPYIDWPLHDSLVDIPESVIGQILLHA